VTSDSQEGGLRILVDVDREMAGRLGVSVQTVNDTLNSAFSQRQISTIYGQANQYRVILEAAPIYQEDLTALARLYVSTNAGAQVPLSTFARALDDLTLAPAVGSGGFTWLARLGRSVRARRGP
jgi:multidrug efflux pump